MQVIQSQPSGSIQFGQTNGTWIKKSGGRKQTIVQQTEDDGEDEEEIEETIIKTKKIIKKKKKTKNIVSKKFRNSIYPFRMLILISSAFS